MDHKGGFVKYGNVYRSNAERSNISLIQILKSFELGED